MVTGDTVTLPSTWSVTCASGLVASGQGSFVTFTPVQPLPHTITAKIVGEFGFYQEVVATVNVALQAGMAEAGVLWKQQVFSPGEAVEADIRARDSAGEPVSRLIWELQRNGQTAVRGEGKHVRFTCAQDGVYRLRGTAYCQDGTQLAFDSTAFTESSSAVAQKLPLPEHAGTLVYLGAVYTQNITSEAGSAPALPYRFATATEDLILLPGTTHWSFDFDPATPGTVEDVVVRTKAGNWCLQGLAGGLAGQVIGYDYGYMPEYIPAPFDLRLRLTADFFAVSTAAFSSFNRRLRIKCYRQHTGGLYRYERCAYGNHPGGAGRRTRRWAALFTELDLQTDVLSGLNRLGPVTETTYSTAEVTTVPLMQLGTSGSPHPVPGHTGLFFTDSNLYAFYEADGRVEIAANAVAGIEQVRPCCISLLAFANSKPVAVNRVKRLHGKLRIYLLEGAVLAGSVVNVRIYRAGGARYTDYSVPITATAYANADEVLLNVGEQALDLADYQFNESGIVVDFSVDESGVTDSALPTPMPPKAPGPTTIYSPVYSHSVSFDGACYTNPTHVPVFDDAAVVVVPVGGCHDPVCGPAAQYCYTAVEAPYENVLLPQPFGFPAPYVAFGSNPARCYGTPAFYAEVSGTNVSIAPFTGSVAVDLWAYTGTSFCGYSYLYQQCLLQYAPCPAYNCSVIVVYPTSSSPHTTVEYGGRCYNFTGTAQSYGTLAVLPVAEVTPVFDCMDSACTQYNASGSVVVYSDLQTGLPVPVRFDHLSSGTAYYGAASEQIDNWEQGLQAGEGWARFSNKPTALVYTATGTGSMMFQFSLPGRDKQLVVTRGSTEVVYRPGIGGSRQTVSLLPGDQVSLRLTDPYGRLPLQCHNRQVRVWWHPLPQLPRLYDTVVLAYGSTSTIRALGFCAYAPDAPYEFYGTLPYSGAMSGAVNPDNLVTVTGLDGQEHGLLSLRAQGDSNLFPLGVPDYAGQALQGPFTFRFYAGRSAYGAHGEMDVWLDSSGTFPAYLQAGAYGVVQFSGTSYRKDAAFTDTARGAYRVTTGGAAGGYRRPNVYVATDGQVASIMETAGTLVREGKSFVATGIVDTGISYTVLS